MAVVPDHAGVPQRVASGLQELLTAECAEARRGRGESQCCLAAEWASVYRCVDWRGCVPRQIPRRAGEYARSSG